MAELQAVSLEDRAVIALGGGDARRFLQGLVTNDLDDLGPGRAIYAALLTPQGKVLHDFFLFEIAGAPHIDCAHAASPDLIKRLGMYRLRADVTIADASDRLGVTALPCDGAPAALGLAAEEGACTESGGGVAFVDPRCRAMGVRLCLPKGEPLPVAAETAPRALYEARRVRLGIAEGAELAAGRGLPLEAGLHDLNGVAFDKGCFIGQEVTARMRARGLVRNRMVPVRIEGAAEPEAAVQLDGVAAGVLRVVNGDAGIAMLKLEAIEAAEGGATLTAGEAKLTAEKPAWARF